MEIKNYNLNLNTQGNIDIVDITDLVFEKVKQAKILDGIVIVFVPGATGAVTTIEYEPGLEADFKKFLQQLIPKGNIYQHNISHHDGNAHSHLGASLLGPSLTVPLENGDLILGTWQQIVFIDFDNRPRKRNLVVKIMGE